MFEIAICNKFRFPFRGLISIEDLYDLSVTNLDSIFKTLNSQLKQSKEESLLEVKTQQDQELDIKINIVKHIFNVKQEEEQLRLMERENKEKKQMLMRVLKSKQDQDLLDKSAEDIQKMIDELN